MLLIGWLCGGNKNVCGVGGGGERYKKLGMQHLSIINN